MVEAEAVENGGVEVGNGDGFIDDAPADVVGLADDLSAFDAAAGEPGGEGERVMSRPVTVVEPPRFSPSGVRPNSEAQMTMVSSSRPHCLRSLSSAAMGWSAMPALKASSLSRLL